MVLFKRVCFKLNTGKSLCLQNLNYKSLKKIMQQNKFNTIILNHVEGRFLFYDCIHDINTLSKSDESFDMIILLKSNEDDIEQKIALAETYRISCGLSVVDNEHKQQQQKQEKSSPNFRITTIDNTDSCKINNQCTNNPVNYDKTILENDYSNRPTFDDIINLDDAEISFSDDLEDDEYDENDINQQITNNEIVTYNIPSSINNDVLTDDGKDPISIIHQMLSDRFNSLEKSIEKINQRLNSLEENVNKRLSNMENNINLIYERQSVESLLKLLDSVYLITAERLETRTFYSNESDLTLKFFHFVSKQLMKHYFTRWSTYKNIIKSLSLKPKHIEINLLGFGRLQKNMCKNKMSLIESPPSLSMNSTINYRLSYASYCQKYVNSPFTHVLVFEGTTSPVYFDLELFNQLVSSSSSSFSGKKVQPMKNLLYKLLQLERMIFFLSFYYKIDLSQFVAGLICFHFYHKSHIDTNLLLKNIMSSTFVEAVPLLKRLYIIDQFILTY